MIINLSVFIIFLCAFFIVMCSIFGKIKLMPSTKGILCITMLSAISVIARDCHQYATQGYDIMFSSLALLVVRQTLVSYKRGFM